MLRWPLTFWGYQKQLSPFSTEPFICTQGEPRNKTNGWVCAKLCCRMLWHLKRIFWLTMRKFSMVDSYTEDLENRWIYKWWVSSLCGGVCLHGTSTMEHCTSTCQLGSLWLQGDITVKINSINCIDFGTYHYYSWIIYPAPFIGIPETLNIFLLNTLIFKDQIGRQ